jgi:S13-like H2TH domain
VSVGSRAPTASGRSPEQRLRALAKANEVRVVRARLKRWVAAGRIELARVVDEPPSCVQTAKVRELLLVVPGIGPARADRVLARCRIAHAKTVAGLSDRQRAELVALLTR